MPTLNPMTFSFKLPALGKCRSLDGLPAQFASGPLVWERDYRRSRSPNQVGAGVRDKDSPM